MYGICKGRYIGIYMPLCIWIGISEITKCYM